MHVENFTKEYSTCCKIFPMRHHDSLLWEHRWNHCLLSEFHTWLSSHSNNSHKTKAEKINEHSLWCVVLPANSKVGSGTAEFLLWFLQLFVSLKNWLDPLLPGQGSLGCLLQYARCWSGTFLWETEDDKLILYQKSTFNKSKLKVKGTEIPSSMLTSFKNTETIFLFKSTNRILTKKWDTWWINGSKFFLVFFTMVLAKFRSFFKHFHLPLWKTFLNLLFIRKNKIPLVLIWYFHFFCAAKIQQNCISSP